MNNEINESNNFLKINNNLNIKKNDNIANTKHKFKKVKSSYISNEHIYEISTPSRRHVKKFEHFLKISLKTKHTNVIKKEKEEINKKNTINSINNSHSIQKEESKKNILGGSISPKNIRKMKIENNDKEKNLINLFQMTDKLYTNDDHFQKDFITKNKIQNKNNSSNIIKRNQFMSGKINNTIQKKKIIVTFGLNEINNYNNNDNVVQKSSFPENSEQNYQFKRRLSTGTKVVEADSELNKSKEKSNFSYFLKLKQRFGPLPKDINDESKGYSTTKHKNHSNHALHNCRTNNEKIFNRRNSQFFRTKTNKPNKHIDSSKRIMEEEKEKEETYIKSKKSNNIKKENSKKDNNNKYNKTHIPKDDVEIPKKEQKGEKNQNNVKNKSCFLCCLTNKLNDSDDL